MARQRRDIPWLGVEPTGFYHAYWYDPEKRRTKRKTLNTIDPGEAQIIFAEWLLDHTRKVGRPVSSGLTVEQAVHDYQIEHVAEKVVDTERVGFIFKNILAHFGTMQVADISIATCRAYRDLRFAGDIGRPAQAGTVRRELGALTAAINHEVRWRRLPRNDVPYIELPQAPEPRTRWLTHEELDRLLASANGRTHTFTLLAYYTASRKKALEELTWFQVDLDRETITLNPTGRRQTAKRRPVVPIDGPLLAHLRTLDRTTPYVLETKGAIRKGFEAACRRASLEDVTPHTLRHTRAVHLAQEGVDLYAIAGLLGDSIATVEKNYLHHCPDHLRRAIIGRDARSG